MTKISFKQKMELFSKVSSIQLSSKKVENVIVDMKNVLVFQFH